MITGSSAAGEAISPHFQFPSKATNHCNAKLPIQVIKDMKGVRGQFGAKQEETWGCTLGTNEKGGMNDEEFEKYVITNLTRLYPDVADVPGYRVILKVDSGPGRMNIKLLAKLRARGWYLYPGVPNTTAITQETDQSFGEFKSKFRANLNALVDERLAKGGKSVSFRPDVVGLLVFGGVDPVTKYSKFYDAYAIAFSPEKNRAAWAFVGAAPLTRKCLESDKVIHNSQSDPGQVEYKQIESTNHNACHLLVAQGFKGDMLKVVLKQVKSKGPRVTVPNSLEEVQAVADCTSYGHKFLQTGADHSCTDVSFKAAALKMLSVRNTIKVISNTEE